MTEPKEGIMSKIMKLLERANHPDTPPHEARLSEEMAEKLMAKHMIDRFEAEQAAKKRGESTRKPIQDSWEVVMTRYKTGDEIDYMAASEFDHQVIDMMHYVLKHCNVRVNRSYSYGYKDSVDGRPRQQDTSRRIYKIVGFREDIAYAERIWFNVFRTFVSNVNPQWDVTKSLDYNAYNFASAGVSWKQQVLLAEAAKDDRLEWPWRWQSDNKNGDWYTAYEFQAGQAIDPDNKPWGKSIHKVRRACQKYCTEHNLEYPYGRGSKLRTTTRSSFARSYRQTIMTRLDDVRRKAKEMEEQESGEKFALALLDTNEQVDAEFYRLFPEYDPEIRRKQRETMDFERACAWAGLSEAEQAKVLRDQAREEAAWAKRASRSRRNYRAVRSQPDRYDAAAWNRGRSAAESVNLRNDGEVVKPNKKEIN